MLVVGCMFAILTGIAIINNIKEMPKFKNESFIEEYFLSFLLVFSGILGLISVICGD